MKLRQDVRVLKGKAISSLTVAMEAFNSADDTGRATRVLLHLQHAFEMLLKGILAHRRVSVFNATSGVSLGFETCLRKCIGDPLVKLSDADAGTLRTIDAMRDDEQHWYNIVAEHLLYIYARAGVTLFDDLLWLVFGEKLSTHLPERVLPISVDPPRDLAVLIDEEYAKILALLAPGRRANHEANARIRTLLAMESHTDPDAQISSNDVARVRTGVRKGHPRAEVFPKLDALTTSVDGDGLLVKVRIVKSSDAAPMRYVADENVPAAAFRDVDLQKKYHRSPFDLASDLSLTAPRCAALRSHLGIDDDPSCRHVFVFKSQRHARYSDNAFARMRNALAELDMEAIWKAHSPNRRSPGRCTIDGCKGA